MTFAYIKKNKFKNKFEENIHKFFNIIIIEKKEKKYIYYVPDKLENRKLLNKLQNKLKENNIHAVLLSKELNKGKEELKKHINLLTGRILFKNLAYQVLEKICSNLEIDIEKSKLTILVKNKNSINNILLLKIAKKVRKLSIITNNVADFYELEKYLYNELGIVIKVSKNIDEGLKDSKIIFNFDFPGEIVNNLKLPNQAIIVNFLEDMNITSKKFNGINVNFYSIILSTKYIENEFENEIIAEAHILNKTDTEVLEFIDNEIKLDKLLGKNGIIQISEFKNIRMY